MKNIMLYCKNNLIYIIFSYLFTFFLVCSFIFRDNTGFESFMGLLCALIITLVLTPVVGFFIIKLTGISISCKPNKHPVIYFLYNHTLFYTIAIFIMQFPIFLAFYPGMIYYDIGVQVDQYDTWDFITNHPLVHTLFTGFFKNLFEHPNTGYAVTTLIQMAVVCAAMGYTLRYVYHKTGSVILCTIAMLFYGLFPVNSVLTISSTKDILFAAFMLIFFIDTLRFLEDDIKKPFSYIRIILNAVLMLLLRNNAIYAFIPALAVILFIQIKMKKRWKATMLFLLVTLLLFKGTDKVLLTITQATPTSIKEMMSIPAQGQARIYAKTDNENERALIRTYIEEPENYVYYLSDRIKQQLPFEVLDSKCKHFLLDSAILFLKHPIIALDSVFYNTQGYWDPFSCPYQSDHFFLASWDYRGGAEIDSKLPILMERYVNTFYKTEAYQNNLLADLFCNIGLYTWIFILGMFYAMKTKNSPLIFSSLFPFLYLLTLCLGPGAIIRYAFPYILMAPVLIGKIFFNKNIP